MTYDFFQDLLRVLSDLLERKMDYDEDKNFLGSHESLLCIHTVLSILSGQGEALTLDPQKFYEFGQRVKAKYIEEVPWMKNNINVTFHKIVDHPR